MALSYIDITSMPNKLEYYSGEDIDTRGLVVHGYDENGNDLGAITSFSFTGVASPKRGCKGRSDARVSTAGAIISSWSGRRSPVKKNNGGDCYCFIGKNIVTDTSFGGNWCLFIGISDTESKASIDMASDGNKGAGKRTINGIDYWCHLSGSNANWGGATPSTITNPLGLPVVENDQSLHTVNTDPTDEQFKKYIRILNYEQLGGAVTIEYQGKIVQYGITVTSSSGVASGNVYIGDSDNVPRKIINMHIGDSDNHPRKIVKAWIGDANNIPRLFWDNTNSFNLFTQSGITINYRNQPGYGGQLAFQSNGTVYGSQSANTNGMFSVPIPARFNTIKIDIESGGRTYAYNYCEFMLYDAPGITGYYVGDYSGHRLLYKALVDYNVGIYSLSRQTIEIDVSNINTDMYVAFHRCDNWTRLYSIKAYV